MNYFLKKLLQLASLVTTLIIVQSTCLKCQCAYTKLTHTSGTQQINCIGVTVTSEGSVGDLYECGRGPYWIGSYATGSYTFTFEQPVSSLFINFNSLESSSTGPLEELSFEINGSFYPITIPGDANFSCGGNDAMISPTGTVQVCTGCGVGAWNNQYIFETISSIKIENIYLTSVQSNGSVFDMFVCMPPPPITDAGIITSPVLDLCIEEIAEIGPATQSILGNNEVLSYILFSNPSNPLGSIIAIGPDPVFSFSSGSMQANTYYYIAAVAGNDLNGIVDLSDPCLDLSNQIKVIWRPIPTVSFETPDIDICDGGCKTIEVHFTGTPPFLLTYTTPAGEITQIFPNVLGTFQICIPPGTPEGSWPLQAISLTDTYCTCH